MVEVQPPHLLRTLSLDRVRKLCMKFSICDLDLVSLANSVRFSLYAHSNYCIDVYDEVLPFDYAIKIDNYMKSNYIDIWNKAMRKGINHSAKVTRLKKRIKLMLEKDCLFLTLTFSDDVLSRTSVDTRHQYISRYLKKFCCPYCANLDFGSLNEREHYHVIIQLEKIDLNTYKYGYIFSQKIVNKNDLKLARYINKLAFHSLKDSTNKKIIYSRKFNS